MFDHLWNRLYSAGNKPQFLFGMTTTNHTPYELPSDYKPLPIQLSRKSKQYMIADEALAVKNFSAFQYACDCLGRFIKKVRTSPLGENTIIVATGDHTIRQILQFPQERIHWSYATPIIMYVPSKYAKGSPDTSVWCGHKDIFPTIFNLALSNQTYYGTGNNLFYAGKIAEETFFGANSYNLAINAQGACTLDNSLNLTWLRGGFNGQLEASSNSSVVMGNLRRKLAAYVTLMRLQMAREYSRNEKIKRLGAK